MQIKKDPALIRKLVGCPIIIISFCFSWGFYAGKAFRPIYCFLPFLRYLSDNFIFFCGQNALYQDPLCIFIEKTKLPNIAYPQDESCPQTQNIFFIVGYATVFSIILSTLPIMKAQLIASSIFGGTTLFY